METNDLKPAMVFRYFAEICQVPRPSKHEQQMVAFLKHFGESHGLHTKVDDAGNVLISVGATPGMERRRTVILQSHIDMVCEKNADVTHDFMTDPIETYIDGEWLRARGTTLGADNGIGVATELAVLTDPTLSHGPVECLFTVDEETGLTGANALQPGFLSGDILLNLDSEEEGQIFIGCAGGVDTVGEFGYTTVPVPADYTAFRLMVKGLKGGHSGGDIHLGRANANLLLGHFLQQTFEEGEALLCAIDGGNLRNAIAREAYAVVAVPSERKHPLRIALNQYAAVVGEQFADVEPDMEWQMSTEPTPSAAIDPATAAGVIRALCSLPHGVRAMCADIPGLVQTSTNLASVKMKPGNLIRIETSQRSSVNQEKADLAGEVRRILTDCGAEAHSGLGYPGWAPNPKSQILDIAVSSYRRLFGVDPEVLAIHAGLECGLFLDKYPHFDMISFGPTLHEVHSPDECMHIPSVQRFWDHLTDILQHIPEAEDK